MPRLCDCVISCDNTSCRIFKGDKAKRVCLQAVWWNNCLGVDSQTRHDVQFSCAINKPLLVHHWRVHQCLLTSRFISPSIPWGVSAPGGKIRKQLLKGHNNRNNQTIFAIESSTFDIFAFKKSLHTIYFKLFWIWWKVLDTIILWQDVGPCCEQTHAAFEVGLSLDLRLCVYSGWSDVDGSRQLRLCHTCIINVMVMFTKLYTLLRPDISTFFEEVNTFDKTAKGCPPSEETLCQQTPSPLVNAIGYFARRPILTLLSRYTILCSVLRIWTSNVMLFAATWIT